MIVCACVNVVHNGLRSPDIANGFLRLDWSHLKFGEILLYESLVFLLLLMLMVDCSHIDTEACFANVNDVDDGDDDIFVDDVDSIDFFIDCGLC